MKRRFLAALLTMFFALTVVGLSGAGVLTAQAAQTFERVNFISGVVIANELNLRTGPSTSHSIIMVLKKGTWVNVLSLIGDWYVVYEPNSDKVGCVAKQYLMDSDTYKKQGGVATTCSCCTQAIGNTTPDTTQKSGQLSNEEQQLLTLINNERAKNGLGALAADMELMKVARTKASDMVQNNYFSHYSPTYGSPFDMMRQLVLPSRRSREYRRKLQRSGCGKRVDELLGA
jgi:uncharacterized protein YgiM (DUF1202 family)